MLTQLSDPAADVTDETDRRHLTRIRTLLLDVQTRHRRLMVVVQKTADEYLELQAEALKLRPLTRLPDLGEGDLVRGTHRCGLSRYARDSSLYSAHHEGREMECSDAIWLFRPLPNTTKLAAARAQTPMPPYNMTQPNPSTSA